MTPTRTPWPYAEALAHMDEVLDLVANGEPQSITRPDGVTFVIQTAPPTAVLPAAEPFVSALSIYEDAPQDEDFNPERLRGNLRDIEL